MSKGLQLLLLHLWFAGFMYGILGTLKGNLAEKNYEATLRLRPRWLWMPGPLAKKEIWIQMQRWLAAFGLVFVSLVYILIMAKILGKL